MKSKFDAISNKKSMKFYANLVENPNFWYLLTNKFKWGHFYDLPRFLNDNQWHKRNDRDLKQVTRGNKMAMNFRQPKGQFAYYRRDFLDE